MRIRHALSIQTASAMLAGIALYGLPVQLAGAAEPAAAESTTATAAAPPGSPALLNGGQEVPAVNTPATARSTIAVGSDRRVSGSVETTGIEGTSAHVHSGASGANGPVVITLTQGSPNHWSIPEGAALTPDQYASYLAGDLYVNVHSAAHPAGEIRLQLHK